MKGLRRKIGFRILAVVLSVCMLFTVQPNLWDGVMVQAAETVENTMTIAAADSGHGNHSGWIEVTSSTSTLAGGKNYYLAGDVDVYNEITVTSGEVTLCLNGQMLTRRSSDAKNWVITVASDATLNVYDCADGGIGTIKASKGGGISTAGTLNVYGGTICGNEGISGQALNADLICLTYGAGIYAQNGSVVNLNGGTVQRENSSGIYVASGGNLTVDGATVLSRFTRPPKLFVSAIVIDGGAEAEVKSGTVSRDSDTYNNCTIVVSPGGSLTVSGGVVSESGSRSSAILLSKESY